MTSVDAVDSAEAAETKGPRARRSRWITGTVVVALLVGVVAWQLVARTVARVELGSFSHNGAGATLPDCVPGDGTWSMFGYDEDVVVVQNVRNPSPWPVMVISADPDAYRFEPMADQARDDHATVASPAEGMPDPAATSDRVVIPPDREAVMWIINPQGDRSSEAGGWITFDGAPLTIRALGVEREFYLPFRGMLSVGGAEATAAGLDHALQEACKG